MIIKWTIVIFLGLVILVISRASIIKPRSHGFWRFFAWEIILVLAAVNLNSWFTNPFSWHQILSWTLLILSVVPLVVGTQSLIKRGKPIDHREDEPQLLALEKTTTLVTTGIYHYIRHPLYSSLLFLTWGIFFKSPGWLVGSLTILASCCIYLTARADELECINFFGENYRSYMQTTKRFIPFCF